jgi:hypothetical protein
MMKGAMCFSNAAQINTVESVLRHVIGGAKKMDFMKEYALIGLYFKCF